jgi:NAD(P)-dependent dehydrogenase (short-subunit alcohol dehydrogenase family)
MRRLLINFFPAFLLLTALTGLQAAAAVSLDADSPTVLITGSNRGIGLAFVKYYAEQGWNVLATCRQPDSADDLKSLQGEYPKVRIEQLDVTDHARIDFLAEKYRGQPIDLLVNNAAILGPLPQQKVGGLDFDLFQKVMAINVYGPLKMSEAFADHVAASEQKKIIALSSGLGSISTTGNMPGFYYYRISKTGLNMAMRGLRTDLKDRGIIVALISPGMVGTELLSESGWTGKSLTAEQSVAGMSKIIAALTPEDKGTITNTDGKTIPW